MKTSLFALLFCLACLSEAPAATLTLAPDTTWIPTKDNTCDLTINLTGAAGNSHVTFQLISTNWPGYCMNKGTRSDNGAACH